MFIFKYFKKLIISEVFSISLWFNASVAAYWKHFCFCFYWWDLLLLFCSLSSQEDLQMTHNNSHLFYEMFDTINESLPFVSVSKPIWYLKRCDWISSSLTPSVLSLTLFIMGVAKGSPLLVFLCDFYKRRN